MAVLAFKAETRFKLGSPFIVFPNLVETGFPGLRRQPALLMDIPLAVTVQLEELGRLSSVPSIRENHQNFALRLFQTGTDMKKRASTVNAFVEQTWGPIATLTGPGPTG